jgi:hypothetical protein
MSDYLASLAARSLKLTGVIRPRLRSIFEPLDFSAISQEDCFIENIPAQSQAATQSSDSPPSPQSSQPQSAQPPNLNAATEKAYSDGIDAIEFRKGNSDGSALQPSRTKNVQYIHPKNMESSAQDLLTSASSPAVTIVDMNNQLGPDGLVDSRIGPEKAILQAHDQEIQSKDIAITDEDVGDKVVEGIIGVEHRNTNKGANHHSGPIFDASSLSLSSSIQASSGDSLREEHSRKSDGCRVQNDLSQERPILSDRNVKIPLGEERRQSANQSLRDHSSLKAPDDFHSEAEPESVAEDLRDGVDLELMKPLIKTDMLHKDHSNRTGQQALMPPIENVAASEKKLFKDPMSPMEIIRAVEAVLERNSENGLPAKSAEGLSASGSALSEEEVHAGEMARPKISPLPSDLPSGEISSKEKPDARILLGEMEFMLHNPQLQDSQSFREEVALVRGSQEKNSVRLRTNPALEEDNAWPGEDFQLRPSFNEIDQYPGESANRARRVGQISSDQETIPYANPPNQDHLHADPIRSEFDESRPNRVNFYEHWQNIRNNSIDEPANSILSHENTHQIINHSPQSPPLSRIASSQIGSVKDKKSAELRPSQTREGLLPSGLIEAKAELPSGEEPRPLRDHATSRGTPWAVSNGLEPEEQMLPPEKTPQIINELHQFHQSSRIAASQIRSVEDKKSVELRPFQTRERLLPSGLIEAKAELPSGEEPRPLRDHATSRETPWMASNGLEPEEQMLPPEKTPQIINELRQFPQSSRMASSQIRSVEDKKTTELRPSQTREGLLPSGQTSTTTRILDLHSSSDRNLSSKINGDDLFFPSSERSVMARTAPNILSSEQGMKSRMNHPPARQQNNAYTIGEIEESPERSERTGKQPHSPQFHVYMSAENIAIAQKRQLSPIKATRKSREASLERKAEEYRDEKNAPSVRVTIGRIEVRAAIAPEKPAEKARSKIQILSLDDYLRLRNGGQR